ncbi:MAG: NAD(P)H-dependent oxidoreductase [Verrucomicrobiota bacterium]
MAEPKLHILAVAGSTSARSVTRTVITHAVGQFRAAGCAVDVLDLAASPLPLFNTDTTYTADYYAALRQRVSQADVLVLGTPDYHGSISSSLKNFLDHFWQEFTGKLFVTIVASHDKGLTVSDQLRTVARQCYGWSLPYAVCFADKEDVKDGEIISDSFRKRLAMMVRDARVYGELLARQRRADLAGADHCFMARLRPKS